MMNFEIKDVIAQAAYENGFDRCAFDGMRDIYLNTRTGQKIEMPCADFLDPQTAAKSIAQFYQI